MIVALCLTIRESLTADSKPLFASTDPTLIAAVGKFLAERLGAEVGHRRALKAGPVTLVPRSEKQQSALTHHHLDNLDDDHCDGGGDDHR
jgi:hypothetical protein